MSGLLEIDKVERPSSVVLKIALRPEGSGELQWLAIKAFEPDGSDLNRRPLDLVPYYLFKVKVYGLRKYLIPFSSAVKWGQGSVIEEGDTGKGKVDTVTCFEGTERDLAFTAEVNQREDH